MNNVPDSDEMTEDVQTSVRTAKLVELGPDKLAAGPDAENSAEIILLEGRADVVNLLKRGFTNVIAVGGTKIPPSLPSLIKGKKVTVFIDGDRGGDLILKELKQVTSIDYVARAPSGKEVEELNGKEIHQCLRARDSDEPRTSRNRNTDRSTNRGSRMSRGTRGRPTGRPTRGRTYTRSTTPRRVRLDQMHKDAFKSILDEVAGSKGAVLLDKNMEILGKVPLEELANTLGDMDGTESVVMDGDIDNDIAYAAQRSRVKYVVGNSKSGRARGTKLLTSEDLQ